LVKRWRAWFAAWLLVAAWASPAVARLPLEAFARLPAIQSVMLSPDGDRFAAVLNRGDESVLVTRDVKGGAPVVIGTFDNRLHHLGAVRWVSNERLMVRIYHLQAHGEDIAGVNSLLWLVSFDNTDPVRLWSNFALLDVLPGGRHVLVEDDKLAPEVHRLDVRTGGSRLVQAGRTEVEDWVVDQAHRVRIGIRRDRSSVRIVERSAEGADWRALWEFELLSGKEIWPLGFGRDPQQLYVQAEHEGRLAVYRVNLSDPTLALHLLLSDPDRDIDGSLLVSPSTGDVFGVRDAGLGDSGLYVWDPELKALLARVDHALPERANRLLQFSADGQRYLMYSSGNGIPGQFFVGNRQTREVALLAETYPDLDPDQLARKEAMRIRARDGLELGVFLTRPKDAIVGRPLPTVILPHGGPDSSDDADFDQWAQFLADRGYAVVQVNFRGSWGLGRAFRAAGFGQRGKAMQDDLTDAVHWLIAKDIADADRICIVGGSYGGYAALMGAALTPDLYRCVVSFAGISDQAAMSRRAHRRGSGFLNDVLVGSPYLGGPDLAAISPRYLARQIQAPVLLVHGSADGIVPVQQSEWMADALRSAGKPVRFVRQAFGDHTLSHQPYRIQFFRELESFLEENLRPRP
jgi:dipeptidyl aminopeptidase/acylaminoacyl peptidase